VIQVFPKTRKDYMSATIASNVSTSVWTIDPAHTVAEFKVKHMMISNVKGRFSGIAGELVFEEADMTNSRVIATLDAASINTGDPQRDGHLKSADFLDVENFPTLAFGSTRMTRRGDAALDVEGELTIHGVTKKVTFTVEGPTAPGKDPWGKMRIGVSATTTINRKDFGLVWNAALETGGILVGDEVAISLDVQFVQV
jgi:polyisoprenoid-binding protein YceI